MNQWKKEAHVLLRDHGCHFTFTPGVTKNTKNMSVGVGGVFSNSVYSWLLSRFTANSSTGLLPYLSQMVWDFCIENVAIDGTSI